MSDDKIIHFPNAVQKSRGGKVLQPDVIRCKDVNSQLHVGPWSFTCQKCHAKTHFSSENMIFRSIDFYCASCGALHRVSNPAFSLGPIKK